MRVGGNSSGLGAGLSETDPEIVGNARKIMANGEQLDVKITRTNVEQQFGFGLASKWRLEGRSVCVCV